MPELKKFPRQFMAANDNFTEVSVVEKAYAEALKLPVETLEELERFVDFWMEIVACIDEARSKNYVAMTCDTTDKEAEARFLSMVENIMPVMEAKDFELKGKFVASPAVDALPERYEVFVRDVKNEIELFRKENIPLQIEAAKLGQTYQKIAGGWMVDWDGASLTVQQVRAKFEEIDRALRERAYRAVSEVHLNDAGKLEELYDKMLEVRGTIAKNADFDNFRDYTFRSMGRFDYTPEDCFEFHRAVKKHVVPVVSKMMETRCEKLGLERLRPWDLSVDEDGLAPLRPFETAEQLVEKVYQVTNEIDPELGGYFGVMRDRKLLDLDSRKGKAPGGYMTDFTEQRLPFIFMNAVGTAGDIRTLLHEGGHSFNLFLCRELEPLSYLMPPLEFAEVASMSMELLALPSYGLVYPPDEIERARRDQISGTIKLLPFIAMIDGFQQWVYLNDSDPAKRADYWETLEDTYRPHIDWSGLENAKRIGWQYPHVYKVPFYYIEYGIAQLGALQVWSRSLDDYPKALADYKHALALGGSRPLPELFEAAGIRFDMTEKTIAPLMETVTRELGL